MEGRKYVLIYLFIHLFISSILYFVKSFIWLVCMLRYACFSMLQVKCTKGAEKLSFLFQFFLSFGLSFFLSFLFIFLRHCIVWLLFLI